MRDFFEQEAREYLERLDRIAAADGVPPEPSDLYAAARGLRGSAQMAREGRVQEVAATLEGAASSLQNGELAWSEDLRDRLRRTADDLRHLVRAQGGPDELEERVAAGVQRWRDVGVEPAVRGVSSAMGASRPETGDSLAGPEQPGFLSYAATELSAIIGELDAAQPELERHPRRADAHAPVIRRAGALLGAAQLGRLGSAATILRALDDVGRTAPRLAADADAEILRFLRQAREALGSAAAALREGRTPAPDAASEEADRLRESLLERRPSATPDAARGGDDFPVEVVNFFRSESGTILDRLERIAGDLADASEERAAALREDARNALAALRDTAVTFGFNAAAAKARAALERAGGAAAEELRGITANLRAIVQRPGGASAEGVAAPTAAPATAPPASAAPATPPTATVGVPATAGPARPPPVSKPPAASQPQVGAPGPGVARSGGIEEVEPAQPIEAFLLRGEAARERALEVVALLRNQPLSEARSRELLEELTDLIRLSST